MLPQVLRFNVSAATTHYGELAPIILGDRLRTDDPSTYAEQLIEEFEQMSARVGLPTRLRDAGVCPVDAGHVGVRMSQQHKGQAVGVVGAVQHAGVGGPEPAVFWRIDLWIVFCCQITRPVVFAFTPILWRIPVL